MAAQKLRAIRYVLQGGAGCGLNPNSSRRSCGKKYNPDSEDCEVGNKGRCVLTEGAKKAGKKATRKTSTATKAKAKAPTKKEARKNAMPILIKDLKKRKIILDVEPSDTIGRIKAKVNQKWQISPDLQLLVFQGKFLDDIDDNKTLSQIGIKSNDEIYMILNMRRVDKITRTQKANKKRSSTTKEDEKKIKHTKKPTTKKTRRIRYTIVNQGKRSGHYFTIDKSTTFHDVADEVERRTNTTVRRDTRKGGDAFYSLRPTADRIGRSHIIRDLGKTIWEIFPLHSITFVVSRRWTDEAKSRGYKKAPAKGKAKPTTKKKPTAKGKAKPTAKIAKEIGDFFRVHNNLDWESFHENIFHSDKDDMKYLFDRDKLVHQPGTQKQLVVDLFNGEVYGEVSEKTIGEIREDPDNFVKANRHFLMAAKREVPRGSKKAPAKNTRRNGAAGKKATGKATQLNRKDVEDLLEKVNDIVFEPKMLDDYRLMFTYTDLFRNHVRLMPNKLRPLQPTDKDVLIAELRNPGGQWPTPWAQWQLLEETHIMHPGMENGVINYANGDVIYLFVVDKALIKFLQAEIERAKKATAIDTEKLKELILKPGWFLVSSPTCRYCTAAYNILMKICKASQRKNVPLAGESEKDREARLKMKKSMSFNAKVNINENNYSDIRSVTDSLTNNYKMVPMVFKDGKFVGGYDQLVKMYFQMKLNGQLESAP